MKSTIKYAKDDALRQWGPIVRVHLSPPSVVRQQTPVEYIGVIDTGAGITAIREEILTGMGLSAHGAITIFTPLAGKKRDRGYDVDLEIIMCDERGVELGTWCVPMLRVLGSEPLPKVDLLIGRDVLRQARFIYDGPDRLCTLEFFESPERSDARAAY